MKRSIAAAATMLALFSVLLRADQAFAQAFNQSSASLTTGYGLSNLLGELNQSGGNFSAQSLYGPYHFKIEKGLTKHLGFALSTSLVRNGSNVGTKSALLGDAASEVKGMTNEEAKNWDYSAVARLNMHIGKSKKFDPYFGAGLGYRSKNYSAAVNPSEFTGLNRYIANTPLAYELGIGARYYLLPFLGVYAELNAGQSPFQGGIIFNMPGASKPVKSNGGAGSNTARQKPVGTGNGNGNVKSRPGTSAR